MFKALNLNIFAILLVLIHHSYAVEDHTMDICTLRDPSNGYPLSINYVPIAANGMQNVPNSNSCVDVYTIDLANPGYANKNVLIEVRINSGLSNGYYTPLLIGKKGSAPGVDSPYNQANNPDDFDLSGFNNRKYYQYISLSPADTNSGGMYYIAFYRTSNVSVGYYSGPISYTISTRANSVYQCPQSCSSHGSCDTLNRKCICSADYFDSDCSIRAFRVNIPASQTTSLGPNQWAYYYLPMKDYGNDLEVTFTETLTTVNAFYSLLDSGDNTLPSVEFDQSWILDASDNKLTIDFSQAASQSYEGRNIIVGFLNTDMQSGVSLNYQSVLSSSDDSASPVMLIIVAILAVLIILTAIITFVKLRNMRRLREQFMQQQRDRAQNESPFLTIEEIDQHFPKKVYGKMNNSFQNSCSVCLEDYQADVSCRQLYCGHVFHDACIEEWLKKHDKCPNCNKLMTIKAINDFKINPNAENESPSPKAQNQDIESQPQSQPQPQPQSQYQNQNQPMAHNQNPTIDLNPTMVRVQSQHSLRAGQGPIDFVPPQYAGDYYTASQMPAQQAGADAPNAVEHAHHIDINNNNSP